MHKSDFFKPRTSEFSAGKNEKDAWISPFMPDNFFSKLIALHDFDK